MEVDWRNLRFLKFERESVCSKIRERERERERESSNMWGREKIKVK